MLDNGRAKTQEDEIIFSARYSPFRVWFSVIIMFLPFMWLFFGVAYADLLRGKYINALLLALMPSIALLFTLDSIFFRRLVFYEDRVVKLWYVLGQRTIYYSRAIVIGPPKYFHWLSSVYAIRETGENGKYLLMQIPISYIAFFFPSATSKGIETIVNCLTGDTANIPKRIFVKSRLPKEAIWNR